MRVELLILFYMAISLMMILFNGCYILVERLRARRFERLAARFEDELAACENRVAEGRADAGPGPSHESLLAGLSRLSGMEAFDATMGRIAADPDADPAVLDAYLKGVAPVFEQLSRHYDDRPYLERAFFAYLVRRWYRAKPAANSIIYCLQRDLMADSLYVRQNAFEAMAHVGEAPLLAHALEALDGRGEGHSPRLVTETLLASTCNQDILASALDARLEVFTPQTASAVINYLRMKSAGSPKHLLVLMGDARTDREVRLACVRYFMRNPHPCALPIIEGFARSADPAAWEFAAVSAMALASYPGATTVELLKGLLSSRNWFVRFNSAKSLHSLGCTLEGDLADVMAGPDRFAREMLAYRWQLENSSKGGA